MVNCLIIFMTLVSKMMIDEDSKEVGANVAMNMYEGRLQQLNSGSNWPDGNYRSTITSFFSDGRSSKL